MTQNSSADNTLQVYLNGNLVKNILNVSAQTSHGSCTLSGSFDCYLFANG
jgi:Leucine-rich repeat (LRR) protein